MTELLDPQIGSLDDVEKKKHLDTIEKLAQQSGVPEPEVEELYKTELRRIMPSTRIREFLPILIGRKVKDDIRQIERDG